VKDNDLSNLSDDSRGIPTSEFLNARPRDGISNEIFQGNSGFHAKFCSITFVFIKVHTNGSTDRASTRKTEDNTSSIRIDQANALMSSDTLVDGIMIFKVICNCKTVLSSSQQGAHEGMPS